MRCPYCRSENIRVDRVRKFPEVNFRWLECLKCNRLFTSEELLTEGLLREQRKAERGRGQDESGKKIF